jgi:hypothetical protein
MASSASTRRQNAYGQGHARKPLFIGDHLSQDAAPQDD